MALQVWLPLNGSASNQGLLGDFTQSTAPSYTTDGKLGKAMTTGAFVMSADQTASVLNNEAVSFCFWVYIDVDTGTTNNRAMFFGTDGMGTNNNRKFSIFNYPTVNDLHLSWMNDTENTTFISCIMSGVLPSREWTHVAITYKNPTCVVYINGVAKYEYTGTSNSSSFAYQTQLIHNASYRRLNDFRIYDHCLSAKEVSEIAKGLVLHYPLSSQYETGMQNKYSGEVAAGKCTSGSFTVTKLADERGYNYKLTYTGNGNDNWPNCKFGNFSFTAGKKYYYSCKVRCHSKNFNIQLRASRSDNDWVTNMVNILNPDGEWHEYHVYQTVNETYNRSGSTVTCNPVLEFFSESLKTADKVYSVDFDVKDVQVVESDCYVPFIENLYYNSAITDCSGLANNGTRSGILTYNSSSPRHSGCLTFNNTSTYIQRTLSTSGFANSYTITYWAIISDMERKMVWGFSDGNRLNVYPTNGFFCWNTGDSANNPFVNNGANIAYTSYNGAWHHYAIVGNGTATTLYIDGEAKGTAKIYQPITGSSLYISGWDTSTSYKWSGGSISDFRIYATTLSADAIKQLYSSAISIDKSGNLYAYEFKEV